MTWKEFDHRSDELARGMAASGVGPGDRVGIFLRNSIEIPELVLSILKVGAVVVPFNVFSTSSELERLVDSCGCKLLFTDEALFPVAAALPRDGGGPELITVDPMDPTHRSVADLRLPGPPVPIADVPESAPAFILYTSGSTGDPKGVITTHGNVRPAAIHKILSDGITFRERALVPVPLVYGGAMISVFMQIVYYLGATLVLEDDAQPEHLLEVIEREKITLMMGVPIVYERMVASPDFATRDISSLTSVGAGGAPVSIALLQAFHDRGISMVQSYGMTETTGLATHLDMAIAKEAVGSAGLPILGVQIKIAGPDGTEVPTGTVGEICIKGESVTPGYWGNDELTKETIVDGWLRSGDLGFLDDQGLLTLVERKKDMLISGGLNVYPAEIEAALRGIDCIEELAVIAVPDEKWGEVPLLIYRSQEDHESVCALIKKTCEAELSRYKHPKSIVRSDDPLPRLYSGKISKPRLRELYSPHPVSP